MICARWTAWALCGFLAVACAPEPAELDRASSAPARVAPSATAQPTTAAPPTTAAQPTNAKPAARPLALRPAASWLSEAQARIADGEYAIQADEDGLWRASNRNLGWRARWDGGGVELRPRGVVEGARVSLGLRGEPADAPKLGGCRADGALDEFGACLRALEARRGAVTERWENRADGLEHVIVLHEPPDHASAAPLSLELEVQGARASVDGDGLGATLTAPDGEALRYEGLKVFDADGQTLWAWMEPTADGLRLRVDARGAAYPVTIDPTFRAAPWRAYGPQAGSEFGAAVASGDVDGDGYADLIVGAPEYDIADTSGAGRVYVYFMGPDGPRGAPWFTQAPSPALNGRFGHSLAVARIDADNAADFAVGAPGTNNGDGLVAIYLGSSSPTRPENSTIHGNGALRYGQALAFLDLGEQGAALAISRPGGDSRYGVLYRAWGGLNFTISFDLADSFDVIAPLPYPTGPDSMVLRTPNGVRVAGNRAQTLGVTDPDASLAVGDVSGDGIADLVVGQPNANGGLGAVSLYLGALNDGGDGQGAGPVFVTPAAWTLNGPQPGTGFGATVAVGYLDANGLADIAIGAPEANGGRGRVAAYLTADPTRAPTSATWSFEGAAAGARLGDALTILPDLDGDFDGEVLVGAPSEDGSDGALAAGAVYLVPGDSGAQGARRPWEARGQSNLDRFSESVASAGDLNADGYDDLAIGAPGYDSNFADAGRVYVYLGAANGPSQTALPNAPQGPNLGASLGASLSPLGDFDGDGYDDFAIGAPGDSLNLENGNSNGSVRIYHGGATVAVSRVSTLYPRDTGGALHLQGRFGASLAGVGDVNGDGLADLLVGAPGDAGGAGNAYLFLGRASVNTNTPADWDASSIQRTPAVVNGFQGDRFGASVAGLGDHTGDGLPDLAIGAPYAHRDATPDSGRVYIFPGSREPGAPLGEHQTLVGGPGHAFGHSLAGGGDVNGDGRADLLVSALFYHSNPQTQFRESAALLYHGPQTFASTRDWSTHDWLMDTDQPQAEIQGLALAGDVNGDGYADALVGARAHDLGPTLREGSTQEGRAWLFLGGPNGLTRQPGTNNTDGPTYDWTLAGPAPNARLGYAVAFAGDTNGDGLSDLLLGSLPTSSGPGAAYLYLGEVEPPSQTLQNLPGPSTQANLGASTAFLGDFNGDGFGDMAVGAPNGASTRGLVQIYLGRASGVPASPSFTLNGGNAGDRFGHAVAAAGDVNGDGYDDLLVGAPGSATFSGGSPPCRAYLYAGGPGAPTLLREWSGLVGDRLGWALAGGYDDNGDGFADVWIGAPNATGGNGIVYHVFGASNLSATPLDASFRGGMAGEGFGLALAAGDFNGDHAPEVAVGLRSGALALLAQDTSTSPVTRHDVPTPNGVSGFGRALASVGDVNGDAIGDLLVGASSSNGPERAFFYAGTPLALSLLVGSRDGWADGALPLSELREGAGFGHSLAGVGDVNNDGFHDLAIGLQDVNEVALHLGTPLGPSPAPSLRLSGASDFGAALAGGDLNGDGLAELWVGAPLDAPAQITQAGSVQVFSAHPNHRATTPARLVRAGSTTSLLSNARACNQAGQLWMSTQGPISPVPVRLQLQVLGAGTPWTPPLGATSTTSDPALASTSARLTLPTQPPGEALRWRARVLFDAPNYSRGPWRYGNAADLPRAASWVVGQPFGVTGAPGGEVSLDEGQSLSYALALRACPGEDLSFDTTVAPSEPRLRVDHAPAFSALRWRDPQTVTLTLTDDELDNADGDVDVTHTFYTSETPYTLQYRATLGDDEAAGLFVDAEGVGGLLEGVRPAQCIYVVLGSQPQGMVSVAIGSARPELLNDALPTLFFDASDWDEPREVCPIALNDSIDRGDTYELPMTFTASGADPSYDGASVDLSFMVQDNDVAGVARPAQAQTLLLSEVEPRSATFTVSLTSDPTDTVTLTFNDTADLTFDPPSVSFNSSTWDEPATITVSAIPDDAAEEVEVYPLFATVSSGDRFYQALGSVGLNYDARISDARLDNTPPTVALRLLDAQMGTVPEGAAARVEVQSSDADNEALSFAWDLDGDGAFGEPGESPEPELGGAQDRQVFTLVFPDGPAQAALRVRASDPRGGVAEASLDLTVSDVPPVFVGNLPLEARAGREYRFEVVVEDPGDDDFVWTLSDAPEGMELDDGPDACPWAGVGPSRCNALVWTPSARQAGGRFPLVLLLLENGQEAARLEGELVVVPNRQPNPLTLRSPEDGAVVGGEVALVVGEGSDPDGDPITYEFEVFDAQTGARVAGEAGVTASGGEVRWVVRAALVEDTLYGWRARAWDGDVNGPWLDADPEVSPAPTFVYSNRNDAPSEPVLLRPLAVASSARPTFEALPALDPERRALAHRFSLYRNEGGDSEDGNDVFVDDSARLLAPRDGALSWVPDASLALGVPHRWCVEVFEASDPEPSESRSVACVRGLVFDGENDAPSAPALLWPLVDGEVQSLEGLVLVAGASEDPEGEEVSHRVTVSLSNTLSPGPTVEVEVLEGQVGLPWGRVRGPLGEVPEDAWVYWRVTATDPQGVEGSSLGRFRYSAANGAPSAPRIRAPGEGEGVGSSDVEFVWGRADDPEGDAVLYEVEVREEGVDAPVWAGEVLPSEDGGGVLGGVPLRERAGYAWRVRAVDVRGAQGAWSEASFEVLGLSEPLLPPAPSLVSPEAGASFEGPAVVGLRWGEVSDPEGRALTYFVEVARARLEGGVAQLDEVWASEFAEGTQEAQVAPQLTGGGYVWRVGVSTPETQPVWSPWRRFLVSQAQEEGEDKDPTRVPQTSLPSAGCAQVEGAPRGLWGLLVLGWALWRGARRRP